MSSVSMIAKNGTAEKIKSGVGNELGTVEDIFVDKNHHPYTIGLFGSIPDLTKKTKRLNPIDGLMPVTQRICNRMQAP